MPQKILCSALVAASALMLSSATGAFAQYAVVGSASATVGELTRTETTVQDGMAPIDQFKIVRLEKTGLPSAEAKAVMLWLPSLGVEFTSYEESEPKRNIGQSIAGFFAKRDFIVYGYSSRAEGVPVPGCELGLVDCSPMAGWDLQQLVDDVAFARSVIAAENPGLPVFVGGLSMGAVAAIATINQAPDDYAGAFLWEGMLFSNDPAVQALNQGYCAGLEAQLAAGLTFDSFGNNLFKKVAKLAELQPEGLTPIPLFPSFLTNHQVLVSFVAAPAPGPFTQPVPGYVALSGDPAQDVLFYASEARLTENVSRFNDYVPLAAVRDLSCSLAGSETSYTGNLAAFDGPILAIGGARGFGPFMQDTLDLTSSTDVTVRIEPDFGHVDHLMAPNHRDFVEKPILQWMKARLP